MFNCSCLHDSVKVNTVQQLALDRAWGSSPLLGVVQNSAHPHSTKPFGVENDASGDAIGNVNETDF